MRTARSLPARPTAARGLLVLSLGLAAACGPDTYADVTGTVAEQKLNAVSYYWGGPFLVFTDYESDCMDMAWVKRGRTYQAGDDAAPVDYDMTALLFTFEETDVVAGNYSVEGDAPVDAHLLVTKDGALSVYPGKTGSLVVDEVTKDDRAVGSFTIGFDEGELTGDFEIEWCNNLKVKN